MREDKETLQRDVRKMTNDIEVTEGQAKVEIVLRQRRIEVCSEQVKSQSIQNEIVVELRRAGEQAGVEAIVEVATPTKAQPRAAIRFQRAPVWLWARSPTQHADECRAR